MPTDAELLRRYVEEHANAAFAELVQRHLDLVYSAALRRTNGRHALAEEIAQTVFSQLARKSAHLTNHSSLVGWLYRSTRYAAIDVIRAEHRRQKLAQTFSAMNENSSPRETCIDWDQLRPVLDGAMDQLKEQDREIMLLRFFKGLTFAEAGTKLNLTENAARMRTERALEKLRVHLGQRGITSTAGILAGILTHQSLVAAPSGLAATVTSAALAAAPAGVAGGTSIIFMSKLTAPILSAALAAVLTAIVWTSLARAVSPEELAALRSENARLTRATAVDAPAASLAAIADEFAVQTAAIVRATEQHHLARNSATLRTATIARGTIPNVNLRGHRDQGQATPHAAFMSFAWASDAGDIDALAKLIWFDDHVRPRAIAVLATMPASLRETYPTPEKFYAFIFSASALFEPPPTADALDRFEAVALSPGQTLLRRPGTNETFNVYQQSAEGWKYVMPVELVENWPQSVLSNETLTKLTAR